MPFDVVWLRYFTACVVLHTLCNNVAMTPRPHKTSQHAFLKPLPQALVQTGKRPGFLVGNFRSRAICGED